MVDNELMFTRIREFTFWLIAVLVIGTCGYVLIEGWSAGEGFYMSVITLATVGYGETRELSLCGRAFTCLLIFVSIATLSCWTACLTSLFVDREITVALSKKKAKKKAKVMREHAIICGTGVMANTVIDMLVRANEDIVVVDSDATALKKIKERYPEIITIVADAVDEIALADANVLDAKCVVSLLESDIDNLMISMSCIDLGTDIRVIAKSDDFQVASRMSKVGVHNVICPSQLSGERAASLVQAE